MDFIEIKGEAQGSTFSIIYFDSLDRYYDKEIANILTDFDKELSVYLPTSLISQFNENVIDSINLTDTRFFYPCLLRSLELKEVTQNNFNVGVKNLVDYLGFGKDKKSIHEIDSLAIDSILNISTQLISNNNLVRKKDSRHKLDFNAIAQGYSVDVISNFLEMQGITNFMVEIGGEMRVKGKNSKQKKWSIGLETPNSKVTDRKYQEVLELTDISIATSGSYRKFNEINGVKYSHAIDPKTGYGVTHNLLSVTVITRTCMDADALATAFLVMGRENAENFINQNAENFLGNIEAYFIEADENDSFKTYQTAGFADYIAEKE